MRRATVDDLDAIMGIESAVFGSDAWSRDIMRTELAGPHNHYLVAFPPGSPGSVDGYAGLFAPRGSDQGDIQTIAVVESARRRGLGKALVLALIAEARSRGVGDVFLDVRADNAGARSLYATIGFEEIGLRTGYYQPDGVDAVVMKLAVPAARIEPA
jgi:N6-L-threonylcarbamoyladenine synthase/ribosomal-protein-alanine N-acetyltransferase